MVVLHVLLEDAELGEDIAPIALVEEPPLVAEDRGLDQDRPLESGWERLHAAGMMPDPPRRRQAVDRSYDAWTAARELSMESASRFSSYQRRVDARSSSAALAPPRRSAPPASRAPRPGATKPFTPSSISSADGVVWPVDDDRGGAERGGLDHDQAVALSRGGMQQAGGAGQRGHHLFVGHLPAQLHRAPDPELARPQPASPRSRARRRGSRSAAPGCARSPRRSPRGCPGRASPGSGARRRPPSAGRRPSLAEQPGARLLVPGVLAGQPRDRRAVAELAGALLREPGEGEAAVRQPQRQTPGSQKAIRPPSGPR